MAQATASGSGLRSKLREHFGFREFRPGQEKVVRSALSRRDTLAFMPTGSGKSLCFQLPALVLEGVTVVVSPLIALMKDQAESLRSKGFEVVAFNSTLSAAERAGGRGDASRGGDKEFIYTTPEQLADPRVPRAAAARADRPVRRRRGALRQPVGPRLPARVPEPGRRHRGPGPARPSWP